MALQLFGIFTVAWGIWETRKRFEHLGFLARLEQWWQARPQYGGGIVVAAGTAHGRSVATGRAQLSIWSNVSSDASVEQRIEALERNLTRVRDDLYRLQKESDDAFRQVNKSIADEQESRARANQEINESMKETATGGLYISAIGAALLFIGVVLGALPAETSGMLRVVTGFDATICN